jgi:hypothetical protein
MGLNLMRLNLFRDNWEHFGEQFINFAVFNPEIKLKIMKVTAFIRKVAKKNDVDTKVTIYFRLRDGKKDIKAASELVISPNHWSVERQGYKDRIALVPENEKMDLNHKVQALTQMIEKEYKEDAGSEWLGKVIDKFQSSRKVQDRRRAGNRESTYFCRTFR